jgi:hypothetical protein
MTGQANITIYHYIVAHAPITAAAIAAGVRLDVERVERTIATFLKAGMIGIAGHDPSGRALYSPLD